MIHENYDLSRQSYLYAKPLGTLCVISTSKSVSDVKGMV